MVELLSNEEILEKTKPSFEKKGDETREQLKKTRSIVNNGLKFMNAGVAESDEKSRQSIEKNITRHRDQVAALEIEVAIWKALEGLNLGKDAHCSISYQKLIPEVLSKVADDVGKIDMAMVMKPGPKKISGRE